VTSRVQRGTFAAVVGASIGFGLAFLVSPHLPFRAAPNQLPGRAADLGFDPRLGLLRLGLVVLLPLLGGVVARWLVPPRFPAGLGGRRAPTPGGRAPKRRRPPIAVPAILAHALAAWAFLSGPALWLEIAPWTLSALLAAASLVLAAVLGRGRLEAGAAHLGAAALVLPAALLGPRPDAFFVAAGIALYAVPVIARLAAILVPATPRVCRTLVVVLLLPGSVTALAAAACMRGPRVADVFEDGHALLPASEYLRGEKPYRDIVPGHGLVSDGLLAVAELRVFGDDYRGLSRGEKTLGLLFNPAFYALGLAATGSPAFGFSGLVLSFLFSAQYDNFRPMASLWTLALALYAARSKRRDAWYACGAALPVGLCIAVEYATYTAAAVGVALWVSRGRRRKNLRRVLLGALASAAAVALVFGLLGILGGFLHATFVFLPALLPVYALGFPKLVRPHDAAALWASVSDPTALLYGFVALSVVLLGAFLPRAPRVGPRARAALPVMAWAVAAMPSVLERWHVGYPLFVVPVGLLLLVRWAGEWRPWTSPLRLVAAAVVGALAFARRPAFLSLLLAGQIAQPPYAPADFRTLEAPPRVRGAVFGPTDAQLIASTEAMLRRASLRPDDTWFDFVGAPGLYYLFDRDCPIRYYEVGFYETEDAQREVIRAIEGNPRVRVALVSGLWPVAIDGVPNERRASLVAAYLRENFRPFFRENGVEFWIRKDGGAGATSAGPGTSASSPP
jgi:hypothetical protein